MSELFKKYDVRAPRYTSYPPVPFWNNQMDQEGWIKCLEKGLKEDPQVDLYIHIPYCEKLCWYCGCNRVISKNKDKGRHYVDALIREFEIYKDRLPEMKVRSLHFGGGTPNFLPLDAFEKLLASLEGSFASEIFEGAIEVDPRTCSEELLHFLATKGFTRISFGVQDFDPQVQKAINREQPFELVQKVVGQARDAGFKHINIDLIWGLPNQNVGTVEDTIAKVRALSPDQISYYSYAHLPDKFKHQRLIKSEDILKGEAKRELYDRGKSLLGEAGFSEIGMDHYASEGGVILKAARERRLLRNFMGYTDKKAANLIGLGASSISSNHHGFFQNVKELPSYFKFIEKGLLPFGGGHLKKGEDDLREEIIQDLMCNMKISSDRVEKLGTLTWIEGKLEEFRLDGLLERGEVGNWTVTATGKKFVRSIALVFDEYFPNQEGPSFSQTV